MPRIFTYDQLSNLSLEVRKSETDPATVTVVYFVRTTTGQSIKDTFEPTLTAGQITQLRDLITNVIIPQIKTREGI